MQTFLPYYNFRKTAQCLDYKRLGKQRVEVWQIYNTLKQGEYKKCACDNGQICVGMSLTCRPVYEECFNCKGTGKIKTEWYNHPAVLMWKGYEEQLLRYGVEICKEWIKRGYKDNLEEKMLKELIKFGIKNRPIPYWLGNEKFHASHRSNLLRKNKEYYSKFGWKEQDNLPYYWPTKEIKCN